MGQYARRRVRSWWPFTAGLAVAAVAATGAVHVGPQSHTPSNVTSGCIDRFDAAADYVPHKATIEDAVHLGVTYHRSYKTVTVRATVADGQVERYVLVQCGAPAPRLEGDLAGAQIVSVPISSLYSASTTHLPLLVDLNVLTGVSQMRFFTGDEILKRAASGQVREFAPISTIDAELVVSHRPGVLMTGGAASASLAVIRGAGIPVVANHEWLEPTALARAEWLKYMALFLNEERAAQQLRSEMKASTS